MPNGIKGFQKGNLNPSTSPQRRKEISEWRKNNPPSLITRKRQSRALKQLLKNPLMREKWSKCKIGHKMSKETVLKILNTKAKKPKKISTLINKLDSVFSLYIRKQYANCDGLVPCFTCGKLAPIPEMDNGHFISRVVKNTRYSELNCHPQCRYCNRYQEGMKDVYALKLMQKYGNDIIHKLNQERQIIKQWSQQELLDLIIKYTNKAKELE